jgi:hypothetical protein
MMEQRNRSLSKEERRLLHAKLGALPRQASKLSKRIVLSTGAIIGTLWCVTVLAVRDVSTFWISVVWLGCGAVIGSWIGLEERGKLRRKAHDLAEVLRCDLVQETVIIASELVEFEEIEDEGACYAFQVSESQIVFISGQDFYPSPKFPCSDFSIVEMRTTKGVLVEVLLEKRGHRLSPARTIGREECAGLKLGRHLQVVEGRLDQIERLLARI